ncbi:hypothetical protein [Lentzea xinjiangensis]|uniref:hypothetical protein n=1 Tax=Lentzea xinjiangensis TaxID=402600 RepID=UPI001160B910|nr:hypothetical protein [Lentzea xinjiangensis]
MRVEADDLGLVAVRGEPRGDGAEGGDGGADGFDDHCGLAPRGVAIEISETTGPRTKRKIGRNMSATRVDGRDRPDFTSIVDWLTITQPVIPPKAGEQRLEQADCGSVSASGAMLVRVPE